MKNITTKILMLIILIGCNNKDITLQNFSTDNWKKDSIGCGNYRKIAYNKLIGQKDKIIGMNESEIIGLFGPPNLIKEVNDELHIFYYIDNGFQCIDSVVLSPNRLAETPVFFLYLDSFKVVKKIGIMLP